MKSLVLIFTFGFSLVALGANGKSSIETVRIEIQNSQREGLVLLSHKGSKSPFYIAAYSRDTLFRKRHLNKDLHAKILDSVQNIVLAAKKDRRTSSNCQTSMSITKKVYGSRAIRAEKLCLDTMDSVYRNSFLTWYKTSRKLALAK